MMLCARTEVAAVCGAAAKRHGEAVRSFYHSESARVCAELEELGWEAPIGIVNRTGKEGRQEGRGGRGGRVGDLSKLVVPPILTSSF